MRPRLFIGVIASAILSLFGGFDGAQAACSGAPTVTCSGVTNNPAGDGFGTGAEAGLTINVLPGASVTGNVSGLFIGAGNSVNNSGTIAGATQLGIDALGRLDVFNSGTISGFTVGISAADVFVTNAKSGVISGGALGITGGNITVTNHGTIGGVGAGIGGGGLVTVTNTGTISGADPFFGVGITGLRLNVVNSGVIRGGDTGILAGPGGGSTIVNAGWVVGGFASIDLSFSGGDTLTLLPGSRLVGSVELGFGAPSTINIHTGGDIAWMIRFGACGCGGLVLNGATVNFIGGAPALVVGDVIVTLDPTGFGLADRNVMDFTGWISSLLNSRFTEMGAGGAGISSFAPAQSAVVAAANEAFASVEPALGYAAEKGPGMLPNAAMVSRESGVAVWTKAFAGTASYDAQAPMLAASSTGYGGTFGLDAQINPILRAGAFIGAGYGKLDVDRDSQNIESDYVFGGVYGRFDWTTQFVDVAVTFGRSSNDSDRTVANNMAAGGLETAKANYDGWFVNPQLAYGVRIPVTANMIVTPIARVRYLAGELDAYNESGSAQTLSVGERKLRDIEERFELAFTLYEPMSVGMIKTTATFGVVALQRVGDKTVDTVLIGQPLSFGTPGDDSSFGGYAGLAFDYRLSPAVNLYLGVEGTVMSDNSRAGVARGGARFVF